MKILKLIQAIFLYITALIGVILVTIGTVSLIDYGIETYIFGIRENTSYINRTCEHPKYINGEEIERTTEEIAECKEQEKESAKEDWKYQSARRISNNIALLIVGIPLWIWGWRTGRKATKKD